MEPTQRLRDRVDVGADVIGRKCSAERITHVFGERTIAAAEQQRPEQPSAAVAVHGDHDVDVLDEPRQRGGLAGVAIPSVMASIPPPWYAMNPIRPRSSVTSSTPGCASRVAKADTVP